MSQATQVLRPRPSQPIPNPEHAEPPLSRERAARSMARNAMIVGLAFILSRVLGLAREIILANKFATGREMDAYVSAFKIPDLLFLVVMSGSFGAAFIPVFGEFLAKGDERRAWRLASAVLTWTGIGVVFLSLACFLLARPLVFIVAPGFDQETTDLTVNLMRILLLSPIFLGFGIAAKGILEAQHEFTLPAMAPLVYNLAIIIGALFFVEDHGIYAVGWGVIVGAACHFLIQIPGLVRSGMRFVPTIDLKVDGLADVAKLLGPRVIGLAAFQLNFIAINAFASRTDEAHVSAINYAWQLLMLPHGVVALSISTVIFPTLAALYAKRQDREFRRTLDQGLRPMLFLSIPAGVGLWLIREPIVRSIYQSGNFSSASTDMVAAPLAWFAIGLVAYAMVEIITRVFYATRDTKTPVITGVLSVVLNIILCLLLGEALGYEGFALALTISTLSEALILIIFLRTRIGHVVTPGFWLWLGKVLLATFVMTVVILLTVRSLNDAMRDSAHLEEYLIFAYAMGLYALTFLVVAWLLRIPELVHGLNRIGARLPASVRDPLQRLGILER